MLRRLFQWVLLAILLAASDPSFAQRKGFGFGKRHHHGPAASGIVNPVSGVTYDTSIGLGVDANGFASLPLNTGASRYYVNSSTGSDSNSCTAAKNPASPKATLSSGLSCLVSGNGDQLLVAQGTGGYTWPNYAMQQGASPQYPTVVQSYDPADPTNEAKLGRATGGNRPVVTTAIFHLGGGATNPSYIAVRGIEFNPGNVADAGVVQTAESEGTTNYYLFENNVFAYTALSFDMMFNGSIRAQHIIVRNSSLYGEWSASSHAQGMYAAGVDGLTIEDCVFWHNGWKVGDAWTDDPSIGGPTVFNHPIYIQDTTRNAVVRRIVIVNASGDGGAIKSGGLYTNNLFLNGRNVAAIGGGNLYDVDAPLGIPIDASYNVALSTESLAGTPWGFSTQNGASGNSKVHYNILAHPSSLGYAFLVDAPNPIHANVTSAMAKPAYTDFENNISYQWSSSGSTVQLGIQQPGNIALVHATTNNNLWDDPTSGTNTNNGSTVFPNAYTEVTLLAALPGAYPDETTAVNAWIADPEQHGWENGVSLARAGYGLTIPALSNLIANTWATAGVASSGLFIGTEDGSALTFSGLPACITPDSDARVWRASASCTASSGTYTVTETNGAASHTTTLPWTIYARPVLSGLSVTPGSTTATINLSTNVGSGKLYSIISPSATVPDWPYLVIGLNEDFSLPVAAQTQAVTATGAQSIPVTGLTASTAENAYVFQLDANNNPSLVGSYAFTTEASGVATLTSPSGTATGSSSATLSVSSDTGSGTLYDIASTSSTAPSVAQIQAGDDSSGSLSAYHTSQTVTATGTQTSSATGLTASTTYYPYFQQHTTAGDSVVVAGASFTTSAGGPPATNIALDFTHLDSSHLFQDTSCTTPVTADLQTAKCIKDTTSGIVATNSTGWVYHANSGKPYLAIDGTSSFATTTSVTFADATGQYAIWMTGQFSGSPNASSDIVWAAGGNNLISPNPTTNANNCNVRSASASLGGAWSKTVTANTDAVFSCSSKGTSGSSGTVEAFVNNVDTPGTGTAAWSGTPLTAVTLIFAQPSASAGRFYGLLIAKGDQTANLSAMQTYMAALHP
jgi:hypothetical protein